ncbi:MAG TPA: hypothetical protein VHB46_16410 [Burkholderiales bacterium]|nr:hypothetical protein [Burkholderiales bacterium]
MKPSHAIAALVIAIALYFAVLEAVTAIAFPKVSQGARRVHEDYVEAVTLGQAASGGQKTVLMLGNSLLVEGVDRNLLAGKLASTHVVKFFPIENTTYFDWYFGIRRLFARGAHPSVVVLCLSPNQLISNSVNGENFAYQLMNIRDILLVREGAHLDTTTTSSFVFANFSSWLGNRASIRNWMLEKWLPQAGVLVASFTRPTSPISGAQSSPGIARAMQRLAILKDLAERNNTRFYYLIPPLSVKDPLADQILMSANKESIPVLAPYLPAELSRDNFSDGFHLNATGAASFTERLGSALGDALR